MATNDRSANTSLCSFANAGHPGLGRNFECGRSLKGGLILWCLEDLDWKATHLTRSELEDLNWKATHLTRSELENLNWKATYLTRSELESHEDLNYL